MENKKKHQEARDRYLSAHYEPRYSIDSHDPFAETEIRRWAMDGLGEVYDAYIEARFPEGLPVLSDDY